jgi:hypothetical protein
MHDKTSIQAQASRELHHAHWQVSASAAVGSEHVADSRHKQSVGVTRVTSY